MAPNPTVTDGTGVELKDPQLRAVASRIANTVRLAGEKAIANAADPQHFPLPTDPNSLERIIRAQHDRMRPAIKAKAQKAVMRELKGPRTHREAQLGALAKIDL